MRCQLLTCGLLSLFPLEVHGQSAARFSLDPQLSVFPLYEGDATVDRYLGVGPSLRASYLPHFARGYAAIEAFGTHTFGNASVRKPSLTSFGIALGARLGDAAGPVQVILSGGLSRLRIEVEEGSPCLPPVCFAEGGADFQDASTTALVSGLGLITPTRARVGLRVDVRLHAPLTSEELGDSDAPRLEFAVGATIRWW